MELLVPALWLYEVGNVLSRRCPDHAARLLAALVEFGLAEAPRDRRWWERALQIARARRVTFYDAAYHALALARGGVFVTADERYARRAYAEGGLVLLRDWRLLPR